MRGPFDGLRPARPNPRQTIPSFRVQNRLVSSQTGSGTLELFSPSAACTVQWIIVQTSAACTLQLLLNDQPFGAALSVNAGAVIRFAGTVLVNDETLGLSVSAGSTISYEVVWVKDFRLELMVLDTAVIYAGSASGGANTNVNIFDSTGADLDSDGGGNLQVRVVNPVTAVSITGIPTVKIEDSAGGLIQIGAKPSANSLPVALATDQSTSLADAPVGTETALITRSVFRKKQQLLTTTPLAANGVFTSGWFDTELTGTVYVMATAVSNVISAATTGFQIQESEDQVNSRVVYTFGAAAINRAYGQIRARYWRVVYTNGGTIQASFSLYITESSNPMLGSSISTSNINEPILIMSNGNALGVQADGVSNQNGVAFQNVLGQGGLISAIDFLFNGSTWDRPRANWNGSLADTGVKTASFAGATQTNFDSFSALITIILGTVSGTTPTLAAQLQYSPDGGTTWINLGAVLPNLTVTGNSGLIVVSPSLLTGLTSGATQTVLIASPLPRTWRLNYTIGGTTPSFTISSVSVNYCKG